MTRMLARRSVYLVATTFMIGECIAGGVLDLARQAPFYPAMLQLGYPSYFADILGAAKLLAVAALLAPGLPRLKEWAYAGIMINMVGAAASCIAAGSGSGNIVPPGAFALIALLSWTLRRPAQPSDTSRPRRRAG